MAEQNYRPNVGIFPFGTSNEFAKFIGILFNIVEALSVIEKEHTKTVDIGKFGNYYFANIAAAGWMTDITYKTSPFLKSFLGEFAYCLSFIKTLFLAKQPGKISITVRPHKKRSNLSVFLIMNGNSVGPLERLINNPTHLDDGYFHLLTCQKTNRFHLFFSLLAKILNITENVSIIHCSKINSGSLIIPEPFLVNLDGERVEVKSMEFKVLPRHLHVFTSLLDR